MNTTKAKFCLFIVIMLFGIADESSAGWEYVSPMPFARYGHDATLGPDGKIYVMGGFVWYLHDGRYSNIVYDPETDSWTVLTPVPGWVRGNKRLFMVLDPTTNTWSWIEKIEGKKDTYKTFDPVTKTHKIERLVIPAQRIRNTNYERQGDGVAIVTRKDGRIYWIGGIGKWPGSFGESIVLPYDSVQGRWPETTRKRIYFSTYAYGDETIYDTDIPPMNERRIDHQAVSTSDGKIYVMGGRQRERFEDNYGNVRGGELLVLASVECYDPESNQWEYRRPMTRKRFNFSAVVGPDDKIYTFGGSGAFRADGNWSTFDTTEVYDPITDKWSYRAPMPKPNESHDAVLGADGKIYVLGGSQGHGEPPISDVFIYDPAIDTWKKGPQMQRPRSTLAAVATPDGKIYAIGGTDVGAYKSRQMLNTFLPRKSEVYDGQVQDTVEVLDILE